MSRTVLMTEGSSTRQNGSDLGCARYFSTGTKMGVEKDSMFGFVAPWQEGNERDGG